MKILFDECLPKRLKKEMHGHSIKTAQEMGWAGKSNGELLTLIAAHFDAFITADRNLVFQQNPKKLKVTVFVLHAASNRYSDLKPLIPKLLRALTIGLSQVSPQIIHVDDFESDPV
jgi:predicted nuclease of predicted toxin-antitoxin system